MTTQHTPGGWFRLDRPENATDEARILTHISNGAHIICTLGTTCTDGSTAHSANARLIAAAPDLLSALEECITTPGALAERSHEYALRRLAVIAETARAAIAKAKGGVA